MSEDDSRRSRVLSAALEAIDELGPDVGMAQIAERAGIPRPHVYRHFASKDQLDAEVARYAALELVRRVRPRLAQPGTPAQIVRRPIEASLSWAEEHPNLYRFLAAQRQTKALHRSRLGQGRFLEEIVAAVRAYLKAGKVGDVVPDGIMAGLMGMVDASTIWWLDHRDETREQVVERLTRQVTLILAAMLQDLGLEIDPQVVLDPGAS